MPFTQAHISVKMDMGVIMMMIIIMLMSFGKSTIEHFAFEVHSMCPFILFI